MPLQADVMQLPPPGIGGIPSNAWNGIPGSSDNVLFANNDLNNTWYLGFRNNITVGGQNTIPVPPSGTVTLAANKTVYAIAASGTAALVVIPGGIAYFQGLTQGQGQLVLPSIRSPNFIHSVSGWTINKDGSAEFNNLTIRGTFNGNNFILNSLGFFLYSGTPAANNLIGSETNAAGTDGFGNAYLAGNFSYFLGVSQWTAIGNQSIVGGAQIAWYYTPGLTETGWILGGQWLTAGGVAAPSGSPLQYIANGQGLLIGAATPEQVTLNGSLQLQEQSGLPSNKVGFDVLFAINNSVRVLKTDGEPGYGIGESNYSTNADQTISTGWATGISAGGVTISFPVLAGITYFFEGTFWVNVSASFQIDLGYTGPAMNSVQWFFQGHTSTTIIPLTALTFVAPTPPAAGDYLARAWGSFNPSANGTFSMAAGKVANNFTVKAGTYSRLRTHH